MCLQVQLKATPILQTELRNSLIENTKKMNVLTISRNNLKASNVFHLFYLIVRQTLVLKYSLVQQVFTLKFPSLSHHSSNQTSIQYQTTALCMEKLHNLASPRKLKLLGLKKLWVMCSSPTILLKVSTLRYLIMMCFRQRNRNKTCKAVALIWWTASLKISDSEHIFSLYFLY